MLLLCGSERWLLLGLCTDVYVPFPDMKQLGLGVSVLYLANFLGLQCLILPFLLEARLHLTDWHWMLDMLLQLLSEVTSNELLSKGCILISTYQVFLNRCHHLFTIPLTKAQNKGWVYIGNGVKYLTLCWPNFNFALHKRVVNVVLPNQICQIHFSIICDIDSSLPKTCFGGFEVAFFDY